MKIKTTDWLNDPLTHLERCGSILRCPINDKLTPLADVIPKEFLGVPVEYDMTYESPGNTITGYHFSDLLTTCIALFPCNLRLSVDVITEAINRGPTDIGRAVMEKVIGSLHDKYQLLPSHEKHEVLVALPGSNVIERHVINWGLVDDAVAEGGWIKPHPLTCKADLHDLNEKYPGRVLPARSSLYGLLPEIRKLYFPANSETGLVSCLLKKESVMINSDYSGKAIATYYPFYASLDRCKLNISRLDKMAALFSWPESGLFSTYHMDLVDIEQWVNAFFLRYQVFPHGRGSNLFLASELLANQNVE